MASVVRAPDREPLREITINCAPNVFDRPLAAVPYPVPPQGVIEVPPAATGTPVAQVAHAAAAAPDTGRVRITSPKRPKHTSRDRRNKPLHAPAPSPAVDPRVIGALSIFGEAFVNTHELVVLTMNLVTAAAQNSPMLGNITRTLHSLERTIAREHSAAVVNAVSAASAAAANAALADPHLQAHLARTRAEYADLKSHADTLENRLALFESLTHEEAMSTDDLPSHEVTASAVSAHAASCQYGGSHGHCSQSGQQRGQGYSLQPHATFTTQYCESCA